jgi:uncharacterized protein (TIGR03067 family)
VLKNNPFWLPILCLAFLFGSVSQFAVGQDKDKADDVEDVDVEELMAEGRKYIQEQDYKAAAEEFQKAVDEDPEYGTAWQLLGYSLHLDGDLDKAIEAHKKAAEFDESKQLGLYNLGCAYSLKNDPDKAFEYLNKAVAAGFKQMDYFDNDKDLDNIRKDARFAKVVARAKNGGREPFDKEMLVGEWGFKSGKRAGEDIAEERLKGSATFTADKVTIPAGPNEKFVMSFKIKEGKKNAEIDLNIESGPAPEGKAIGIVKFDDKKLVLCYDPEGKNRPAKFESTGENGCFLFVLEKKADDKKSDDSKDKDDK